ncbi:MAG TPA: flagellar basal body P-ring formation chaperone FlgA [Alphaproteobacteria bacterium]|nr:flagellar basal body P-ring formation chaperone FlgA [Alphaproteobacteria bacterium]
MRYLVTSFVLALTIGFAPAIALGGVTKPGIPAKTGTAPVVLRAKVPVALRNKVTVALRDKVTVAGEIVRLGDLFQNTGERAHISVAHAPAPGASAVLDAEWLTETARRHGLDWRPASRRIRLVLRRASRPIERDNIARRIAAQLQDRGTRGKLNVTLDLRVSTVHLPVDAGESYAIRELRHDERSGRLVAKLVAPASNPVYTLRITGRLQKLIKVPVLARHLRRGDIVRGRDVVLRAMDQILIPSNAVIHRDDIIGQAARRSLPSGLPVRNGDLEAPTLIRRGALVTMEISTPMMRLTARGKALDNGTLGETVRIRNIQSKRVIQGTVVGLDRVRIAPSGSLAAR